MMYEQNLGLSCIDIVGYMKCLLTADHLKPGLRQFRTYRHTHLQSCQYILCDPFVSLKGGKIEYGRLTAVKIHGAAVCQQWPYHNFHSVRTLTQEYLPSRTPRCKYNVNPSVKHKMQRSNWRGKAEREEQGVERPEDRKGKH